jgi:hypothetical protein
MDMIVTYDTVSTSNNNNLNNALVSFCQQEQFKKAVRDAVNNELFWREVLKSMLGNNIETKIDNKLSDFKDRLKDTTSKLVDDLVKSYTKNKLPKTVATEVKDQLDKQITTYLNNNPQMIQLLSAHAKVLEETLYQSAKDTLDRLTNEEQYHSVTTSHLQNMTARCELTMNNQLSTNIYKFNDQLKCQQQDFDKTIVYMNDKTNKTLENFNNFNDRAKMLEKKIEDLQTWSTIQSVIIGVVGIGFVLYNFK